MPTRKDLEKLKSLQEANNIIGELELDLAPGISKKFCRSKWDNRIIKTLLDEYIPLLRLAEERQSQEHWYVRGVRLSQDSNKGEDGEILFWGHRPSKVQVTRANMNHETELIREHMEAKKSRGYPLQECCGNPLQEEEYERVKAKGNVPKHVKPPLQERFLVTLGPVVIKKLEKILGHIDEKEKNYRSGTDTLVVVSDRYWPYLREHGLHEKICQEVKNRPESSYRRIYILYLYCKWDGKFESELKRVK